MVGAGSNSLEIMPQGRVGGEIRPPGSKSITNRAIIVAALAAGASQLEGVLDSEDTRVMIESWRRLGISIEHDAEKSSIRTVGCGGRIPQAHAQLFLANSGTSIRFLTAAVALGRGEYRLDGVERMRQRPIEGLLRPLRALGAEVESELGTGCPPVRVRAGGLRGGRIQVAGGESSQFTSAILMAAPYAAAETTIEVSGELVSEPFVAMTMHVMREFGVAVATRGERSFVVPAGGGYAGRTYWIEPDATAAGYFLAAAALTAGTVTVAGLDRTSIQGDLKFLDVLERMGAEVEYRTGSVAVTGRKLTGVSVDMADISDTVPTLAVLAAFAEGPTTIRNVAHIRHQETDRIRAMVTELRRIGLRVDEYPDGFTVHPSPPHGATIETYKDHRIAMSFALVGLRVPGIVIQDPGCTSKTYPNFFSDLASLRRT